MRCVDDHDDMISFPVDDVRLDLCPECKGIWFDAGELERCAEKPARKIRDTFGAVITARTTEGLRGPTRRCPRCEKVMDKERFLGGVWIDRCPDRHGVWLDAGEMHAVYEQMKAHDQLPAQGSRGNPILDFMAIQFAVLFRPLLK